MTPFKEQLLFHILEQLQLSFNLIEKKIMSFIEDVNSKLDTLTTEVTALDNTVDSAIAVITTLDNEIQALVAAGATDPTSAADALAKISALSTAVVAKAGQLHDAVQANTPAATVSPSSTGAVASVDPVITQSSVDSPAA